MVDTDALFTDTTVGRSVNQAVRQVARSQRDYLPVEELRQEAWMWVFDHGQKVDDWLESDETGKKRHAQALITSSLRVHLHALCQKERMHRDGTEAGDYYYYSKNVVEELLPDVFDEDAGSTMNSQAPRGTFVRGSRQPDQGFEYQAMLADVRGAFVSLNQDDKRLLWDRYGDGGMEVTTMAISMQAPERTVRYKITRAINRLIRHIGGEQPRRMRAVKSNAASQVATRTDETGA